MARFIATARGVSRTKKSDMGKSEAALFPESATEGIFDVTLGFKFDSPDDIATAQERLEGLIASVGGNDPDVEWVFDIPELAEE